MNVLPKTRSGKLPPYALQAVAERRDPGPDDDGRPGRPAAEGPGGLNRRPGGDQQSWRCAQSAHSLRWPGDKGLFAMPFKP